MVFMACYNDGLKQSLQLGIHYSDNSKEIEMREIQNNRIRKAWEYMYISSDKETKKLMKKAYEIR